MRLCGSVEESQITESVISVPGITKRQAWDPLECSSADSVFFWWGLLRRSSEQKKGAPRFFRSPCIWMQVHMLESKKTYFPAAGIPFRFFFRKKNVPNPMSKLMQPSPAYPIPSLMSSPRSSLRPPTPHHTTNIHQPPTFRYLQYPSVSFSPTRPSILRPQGTGARGAARAVQGHRQSREGCHQRHQGSAVGGGDGEGSWDIVGPNLPISAPRSRS